MLTLIIWLDYLLFVTSPHCKVLFFLPFHIGPFERQSVTLSSSHVRGGGLTKYQHKLFEILLQERLVSSSYLLIRSIFFFFFFISMDSCIFFLYFGLSSTVTCVVHVIPALAIGCSFCWLLCPFDIAPLLCSGVFLFVFCLFV
uniref:Uncharacterized protein n=1 Tax=Rousettus aegyptiacus TaxID=9407 RepID=A0A7J8CI92_ROUAE|nr:hypothetical protein HJG63_009089 [Rousettus aegyptiacus]